MPAGKAPGPNGFPSEFIKHFWLILAPLSFRTVTEIKSNGCIRPQMNTAAIKLLLKPDKVFNPFFSQFSKYSINWSKSTVLPITEKSWYPAYQNTQYSFPLGNIKYLGINISPKLSELVYLNLNPLLDKICGDLQCWNNLPISHLGWIATIKMKKNEYLFSMIPFKPTFKWFQTLDSAVIKFYSKNKKAKISLSTLQKNKPEGGLVASTFMFY